MERDRVPKSTDEILAELDNGIPEGTDYVSTSDAMLADIKRMNKEAGGYSPEAIAIATSNLANVSHLRLTANDHATVGSGSPERYKTRGWDIPTAEYMDDLEILEYLDKQKRALAQLLSEGLEGLPRLTGFGLVRGTRLTIDYLRSIGRLPEKYEDFDVQIYAKSVIASMGDRW